MAPPEQTVSPALVASPRPIKAKPVAPVNIGRWTDEEHAIFLDQLRLHNRDWKKISAAIPSRTIVQIRTQSVFFITYRRHARAAAHMAAHTAARDRCCEPLRLNCC